MRARADIVVFGTGSFAGRIVCDLAATAGDEVRVAVAGRNLERLNWLTLAANARATIFQRPAQFLARAVDLTEAGGAEYH